MCAANPSFFSPCNCACAAAKGAFSDFGCFTPFFCVGMTETATAVSVFGVPAPGVPEVNSCGRILPGIVCRIVKEDGSFGGYGDRGELLVKSPGNALCYSNNEQACVHSIFFSAVM